MSRKAAVPVIVLFLATERDDPASLLNWYRDLLALRKASPALQIGALDLATDVPDQAIRYERSLDGTTFSVIANLGRTSVSVPVSNAVLGSRTATALLVSDTGVTLAGHLVDLPANTAAVIELR